MEPVPQPASIASAPSTATGRSRVRTPRGSARGIAAGAGVATRQLGEDPPQRDAAAPEQHHAVEPEVGDLGDHPRVAFAPERRGDHLGALLADLPADLRLAPLEELRDVRARGPIDLARLDRALDHL